MRSYEFSAKSVDKAIKLGLETLNKKQEEVDIKIISEGGFFKKAKSGWKEKNFRNKIKLK